MRNEIIRNRGVAIIAIAAGLAACSGGSGGDSGSNGSPTVSGLADLTIAQDSVAAPLAFTIDDRETPAADLVVTATSGDTAILPADGIVTSGSGASRSIALTPAEAAMGDTVLTIVVRDAAGAETRRQVRVRIEGAATDFSALAKDAFALAEDGEPRPVRGLSIRADVDDDDLAFSALVQ
jgi:hypothetical protein